MIFFNFFLFNNQQHWIGKAAFHYWREPLENDGRQRRLKLAAISTIGLSIFYSDFVHSEDVFSRVLVRQTCKRNNLEIVALLSDMKNDDSSFPKCW